MEEEKKHKEVVPVRLEALDQVIGHKIMYSHITESLYDALGVTKEQQGNIKTDANRYR